MHEMSAAQKKESKRPNQNDFKTPHHNGQIDDRNEHHNDDQQQNQLMLLRTKKNVTTRDTWHNNCNCCAYLTSAPFWQDQINFYVRRKEFFLSPWGIYYRLRGGRAHSLYVPERWVPTVLGPHIEPTRSWIGLKCPFLHFIRELQQNIETWRRHN